MTDDQNMPVGDEEVVAAPETEGADTDATEAAPAEMPAEGGDDSAEEAA